MVLLGGLSRPQRLLVVDRLWIARIEGTGHGDIRSLDQILHDDFESLRAASDAIGPGKELRMEVLHGRLLVRVPR